MQVKPWKCRYSESGSRGSARVLTLCAVWIGILLSTMAWSQTGGAGGDNGPGDRGGRPGSGPGSEQPAPPPGDDTDIGTTSTTGTDSEASRGEEHSKLLRAAQTIAPLGTDLFGETVNLFTGSTEFRATDVSLPSHAGPLVAIGRRFVMEDRKVYGSQYLFADWDLDIPYLSNVGPDSDVAAWRVNTATPAARCSSPATAAQAQPPRFNGFNAFDFWQGMHLNNASGGGEMLWTSGTTTKPSTGGPWRWVTKGFWHFSCLPSLRSGQAGEGFQGLAPDGTKYRFDWMSHEQVAGTSRKDYASTNEIQLLRREVRLYPTRIEDRFGNWVEYDWVGEKLVAVRASDGRVLTLSYVQFNMGGQGVYDTGNRIASISDGSRSWTYSYDTTGRRLTRVTRPDSSAWQIDFASISAAWMQLDECLGPNNSFTAHQHIQCLDQQNNWDKSLGCSWMKWILPGQDRVGRITHPSGAVGEFAFRPTRFGRTRVRLDCVEDEVGGGTNSPSAWNWDPVFSDTWAIVRKTVTGPGLLSNTWSFAYPVARGSYAPDSTGSQVRVVTLTHPDGSRSEHSFGTTFGETEGQALMVRTLTATGVELARATTAFVSNTEAATAPFPDAVGISPQPRSDQYAATRLRPEKRRDTVQQGTTFTWQVASVPANFDAFGNPTTVVRSSSLGFSRTETTTYHHNTSKWVLGQIASQREASTGLFPQETSYDSNALPTSQRAFGLLIESYAYHPDGALRTVTDGNGRTFTLSNWFRGVPRTLTFPDGSTRSAVVDALGQITSTTDELGFSHSYAYDALGRLRTITYPTADSTAWTATQFSFVPVATSEFGLPAGHWRHTESTGSYRKTTYFDARFRPVLTLEEDTSIAASKRYLARCFDHEGRETFAGYPVAAFSSFSPTTTCAGAGLRTSYDALGRITSTVQTSELGNLTTTTSYLAGFQTRTTSPLGRITTSQFQAFDRPDSTAPVSILSPEGVTTTVSRDVFGKPLTLTRSGSYAGSTLSTTRRFVYDSQQRLCKRIQPESGATVFDYDPAGNLLWQAEGSTLTGTTCDRTSVPLATRIQRSYDPRNRLLRIDYPDTTPDTVHSYFPDGALHTLSQGNSVWTYAYNKRRLLTQETLSHAGAANTFSYTFTSLGHLSSRTTPSGLSLAYAPNALGQATRAGFFATAASYFPDGSLKQFTYGNGFVRTLTQNARLLPSRVRDVFGTSVIHDFSYAFDKHGNLTQITDADQAGLQTRSLAYDARDRLISANATNLWGSAAYTYDPLDNLRSADQGSRQYRYTYATSTGRLDRITTPTGTLVWSFGHDPRGNQTSRTGQTRSFDGANRITAINSESYEYDGHGRRTATWRSDGSAKVEVYTRDGKLGYIADNRRGGGSSPVYLAGTRVGEDFWRWADGTRTPSYSHTDILGSTVVETDTARNPLNRTYYAPFGEPLNRSLDTTGYTGHVHDASTGLVYAQQRYYDPIIGQFLSTDPVEANPNSGSNFNRYWYANNNPYTNFDPDGRACDSLDGGGCGAPRTAAEIPRSNTDRLVGTVALGAAAVIAVGVVGVEVGLAALANPAAATALVGDVLAGDAAGGASLVVGASALTRAKELQSVLSPRTQRAVTTAVAETSEGVRVVGSSEGALRPTSPRFE